MILTGERAGGGGVVKLADGLGGIFESGVRTANYDLGDNSGDFLGATATNKSVVDGLGEPVADLALTHGDGGFERHGGCGRGGSGFFVD